MTPLESSGRPSPGDRPIWSATFLLTALAGTAAVAAALLGVDPLGRAVTAAAAGAAGATLVLLAVLRRHQQAARVASAEREREFERQVHGYRQQLTGYQQQLAEHQQQLIEREAQWRHRAEVRSAAVDDALEHLLRVRLPAVLAGAPVPATPPDRMLADRTSGLVDGILAEATSALKRSDEREESLRLAVVALSRRVQTAAHSIQEQVSLMADRHQHDPDVVESSMRVDHAAAQQARHAQSLAVLCGEWPGQQWQEPLAMVDVVRAASARILAYQRVEVSGDQDVAVAAEVVEPVIHLVAELLANATQSSPPATIVPVTVRRVQRGAVIEIDDGGVGMDDHRLEQARETVSGRRPVGLGELGEIPQTGLAVVGHYVRRHGFRADLSESPYGGLRAVVLIPSKVVETVDPPEAVVMRPPATVPTHPPAAAPQPQAHREWPPQPAPVAGSEPVIGSEPVVAETGAVQAEPVDPASDTILPRRRSRRGEAVAAATPSDGPAASAERALSAGRVSTGPAASADSSTASVQPTPEQAGSWMGAFISGGRAGAGRDPEGSSSPPTTTKDDER
ncbi:ATP-binding protein [Plantactinospora sp. WMMB782]|uniref:ATP-binding protein n=1 Tax=Plantactinospora sp. WMMB782 TaxID=3404121 RepID=UPI003B95D99C